MLLSHQALEMFTSLCMFEEAKQLAEQAAAGQLLRGTAGRGAAAVAELMGRQAAWSEETANYEAAAEMYIKVCCNKALHLLGLLTIFQEPCFHGRSTGVLVTAEKVGWDEPASPLHPQTYVCSAGWQV